MQLPKYDPPKYNKQTNQTQSPLEVMLKVVLVGALFLRPQIISRPTSVLYDAIAALVGGARARSELARRGSGGGDSGGGGGARPSVWRAA